MKLVQPGHAAIFTPSGLGQNRRALRGFPLSGTRGSFLFAPVFFLLSAVFLSPQTPASAQNLAAAPAQAAPGPSSQTFMLDETFAALKSAGSLEFRWDPFLRGGVFSCDGHYGAFYAGLTAGETGYLLLDGREIITVPLPYYEEGQLVFPRSFVQSLKDAFTRSLEEDISRFRIAAIIIDPGHGGRDPGAIGTPSAGGKTIRAVEKDIVLNASKQLRTLLRRAYPDKQILMTRDRDTYPSLEDRVAIANSVHLLENEAVIYISVHANYVFNSRTRGYEVWYLSPDYRRNLVDRSKYTDSAEVIPILNDMLQEEYTMESILMAQSILRGFQEALGNSMPSRGIKAEEWFVVRNSRMPAVLVELGFVSNPEDARIMTSEGGLRKMVDALYKGISEFVGVFERSGGFTAVR